MYLVKLAIKRSLVGIERIRVVDQTTTDIWNIRRQGRITARRPGKFCVGNIRCLLTHVIPRFLIDDKSSGDLRRKTPLNYLQPNPSATRKSLSHYSGFEELPYA